MRRLLFTLTVFCATLAAMAQGLTLPLPAVAEPEQPATQEVRIGVLDVKAIFQALPETAELQKTITFLQSTYQAELQKLEDEYQNKVSTFLADRDRLPKNIQDARIQEIDQLQLRIQAMRREAADDLDQKQADATAPLRARVSEAIKKVSQEQNLAYVLDLNSDAVLYVSPLLTVNIYTLVMRALTENAE